MTVESIPQLRSRVRIVVSILVLSLGALAVVAREVASQFERFYTDLGAELPLLTQMFLDFGGGWPFLAAVVLGIAFSAVWLDGRARRILEVAQETRPFSDEVLQQYGASVHTWALTASVLLVVAVLATVAVGAVALYLPMIEIVNG
ncbi:MAG: hypothetical protein HY720_32070 [Planctomycetes bacterium]|nr:hypothetical protein [Planctomycetota bacterium]